MATNIKLNNDITNNVWTYSPQIDKQSGNTLILNTANQFLDKNIQITPTVSTTTRTAGEGIINLTAGSGSATFSVGTGDSQSLTNPSLAFSTTTPSSGVYYTLIITGKGTVSGSGSGKVSTGAGWITSGTTTSNSATSSKTSNSQTLYRYINKSVPGGVVINQIPSDLPSRTSGTYEDIELQSKSYVMIPKGYNPKDRYIYANIDEVQINDADNFNLEISSVSGTDEVIVGSTNNNGYYDVTANNLSITGTFEANTAGWFATGEATDNDTDSVTVGKIKAGSCTIKGGVLSTSGFNKQDLVLTLSNGFDTTFAANSYALINSKDTTNYPYYFKITGSTPAISGTTTASVTAITDTHTAGYIPPKAETSFRAAQSATPSVSINSTEKSAYIGLKAAALSASISSNSAGSASMTVSGFTPLTGSNTSNYYVTLNTTAGSVKATAGVSTAGYAVNQTKESAATSVSVGGNGTKLYIPAGSYSASINSHSITTLPKVTGTLNGTITNIGTTTKPSGTDGTDYWTITPSGTVTTIGVSTASGKAIIDTAGYIPVGNKLSDSNSTVNITPNISVGTARYIPKAVYSTSAGVTTITTGGYLPANTKVTDIATISPSTGYSNVGMSNYFTTGTSSDYDVKITPNYTNNDAGYLVEHSIQNNGGIGYWKIKTTSLTAGNGSLELTKGAGEATLTVGTGDSANSNNTSLDMKTTTPNSGVYYTLTATGKGTVSGIGKGSVSVGTGWITSTSIESSEDTDSETSYEGIAHGYILKSVHGNTVSGSLPSSLTRTSGTYQDIEIQPKGYVKIPKGYNPIDRYIFANIADELNEARPASGYSLSISSISGDNTVTVGDIDNEGYYPIIANDLSVTGTLSASTAGWFSSGEATDSDTDSVTVGKIQAGSIEASITSHRLITTPVVKGTLSGTITNIGTTTKPSGTDGTDYWTITPSGTVTTTGISKASGWADITTAGYIPVGGIYFTNTNMDIVPNVQNGTVRYIPKAVGSTTCAGGNLTWTNGNAIIDTTSTNGVEIKVKREDVIATSTITTAGYTPTNNSFSTGPLTAVTDTKYITGVTLTAGKEFNITVPNGSSGTVTFHFAVDNNGNTTIT